MLTDFGQGGGPTKFWSGDQAGAQPQWWRADPAAPAVFEPPFRLTNMPESERKNPRPGRFPGEGGGGGGPPGGKGQPEKQPESGPPQPPQRQPPLAQPPAPHLPHLPPSPSQQQEGQPDAGLGPSEERSAEPRAGTVTPPPVAARLTGDELGKAESKGHLRRLAKKFAWDNFVGDEVENRGTGMRITINWSGFKKAMSGTRVEDLLRATPAIPKMLEQGTHLGAEPDNQNRRSVRAIHRLPQQSKLMEKFSTRCSS